MHSDCPVLGRTHRFCSQLCNRAGQCGGIEEKQSNNSTLLALREILYQRLKAMSKNPLDLLPDFANFTYQIAVPFAQGQVRAWGKLRECERRLEMYKWVEILNDPRITQHRILLDDSVSAFLLTFEATQQFLKTQLEKSPNTPKPSSSFKKWWNSWLSQQPQYDVTFKGLRTLRHLEAHVEEKPTSSLVMVNLGGSLPDGTSDTDVSRMWRLPKLQQSDLDKLNRPPLEASELNNWNNLVSGMEIANIFTDALWKLKGILVAAEPLV